MDLELDVIRKRGKVAEIVDEDEFQQAIKTYEIPKDSIENATNAASALLDEMSNKVPPFDRERIDMMI